MLQWRESGSWTFRHMILQGSKALLLFDVFFSLFWNLFCPEHTSVSRVFSAKSLHINNFLVSGCILTENTSWYLAVFFCGKECLYSKIVRKWVPIMCAGSLQNVSCTLYVREPVVVIVCFTGLWKKYLRMGYYGVLIDFLSVQSQGPYVTLYIFLLVLGKSCVIQICVKCWNYY